MGNVTVSNLRINTDFLVGGWPGVRINSGSIARWGDFGSKRCVMGVSVGASNWSTETGVNKRTQFLLDFLSSLVHRMRALVDDLLPLEDG